MTENEIRDSKIIHKGIKQHTVISWPHVDIDKTITYTDGKITQIEIVGFGYTKTQTFTYDGDNLTGITTVIT
jgi:hypothetical protein